MDVKASLELRAAPALAQPLGVPFVPASKPTVLRRGLKHVLTFLFIAVLAYGSFQFITHYLLQSVQVVGVSMTPTLHDSERYILNRWIYHVREPQPKEIVVLRDPAEDCYAVKRIVAKAGDTVSVKDGHLFVNGKLLDEPYLAPDTPTYPGPKYREQMWVCGVNQYFVLGDNRNNSADSRTYGTVSRQNILGMVMP
jgi:signal peptidase I